MGSSVSDLTVQLAGFAVKEGHGRFARDGWLSQGVTDLRCGMCGHSGTFVLRKHYVSKGSVYGGRMYHYWAIACGSCEAVSWLTMLQPELVKEYRKWDQTHEFDCPECLDPPSALYLVLANSRKLGAHCVAVVDGNGDWIRPVATGGGGALSEDHCWLTSEKRILAPLDAVEADIGANMANAYQPEDRAVPDSWSLAEVQPSTADTKAWLKRAVNHDADFLLRGGTDRISESDVASQPLESSLALVRPQVSGWRVVKTKRGKRQVRVSFTLDGVPNEFGDPIKFDLAVTDPKWDELVISKAGNESRRLTSGELGVDGDDDVYFTLSLGEPFKGDHYKLVAGVILQ